MSPFAISTASEETAVIVKRSKSLLTHKINSIRMRPGVHDGAIKGNLRG